MPLKMNNFELMCQLPELPTSIAVFALTAPSLDNRRTAINRLGEYFKLGKLRSAELNDTVVMASARGDIHYFHASGAVLVRDATAGRNQKNEFRKWDGLQSFSTGGNERTRRARAS